MKLNTITSQYRISIACFYTCNGFLSHSEQAGRVKCPVDPYFIIPDKCACVDFQTLRLQEAPDAVPHGEMPRHMQLYCDRYKLSRDAEMLFVGKLYCEHLEHMLSLHYEYN